MNILSGKLTGHRPATIVGNMNLKGNGDVSASKEGVVLFPPPIDILGKTNIF